MGELQQAKIPFGNLQASGFEEVGGASPSAFNIITEPVTGVIRRRPGLVTFCPVIDENGIVGMYETVAGEKFAVANPALGSPRPIYRFSEGGASSLSGIPEGDLRGSLRPIFAETEAMLVIAGGKEPQKILLSSFVSSRLGGDPPHGSHVLANSERLVMNEVEGEFRNQFRYSGVSQGTDISGNETWSDPDANVSGFISAEAKPDPIVAQFESTNEVFTFGTTSLQIFSPDPNVIYGPSVARTIGCGAVYSVVRVNNAFAWIDEFRRIVISDGRELEVISDPIQKDLLQMETVSDAYGYRIVIGPIDVLVWTFPAEQRTFAFQKGSGWSTWTLSGTAPSEQWAPYNVLSTVALKSGATLGATSAGEVGTFTLGAPDFDTAIDANMTTGFQDRGTNSRKHCRHVRVALRPLSQTDVGAPVARISYRDGIGAWEPPLTVAFGRDTVVQFDSLGTYRRRQWKFEFTGANDMALVSVTEDFEVLEN